MLLGSLGGMVSVGVRAEWLWAKNEGCIRKKDRDYLGDRERRVEMFQQVWAFWSTSYAELYECANHVSRFSVLYDWLQQHAWVFLSSASTADVCWAMRAFFLCVEKLCIFLTCVCTCRCVCACGTLRMAESWYLGLKWIFLQSFSNYIICFSLTNHMVIMPGASFFLCKQKRGGWCKTKGSSGPDQDWPLWGWERPREKQSKSPTSSFL